MKISVLFVLFLACTSTAPTLDRARQSTAGTGLIASRRSSDVFDRVPEFDRWLPPSGKPARRAAVLATGAPTPSPLDCRSSSDPLNPAATANTAKAQSWLASIKAKGYDPKIVAEYEPSLQCGGQIVFGWLEEIRLENDPSVNPLEWMCAHGYNSPLWYAPYTIEGDRPSEFYLAPPATLYEVVVQINDRKFVVPVTTDTGQTHWKFRVFAPCEVTWFKGIVLWHARSPQ